MEKGLQEVIVVGSKWLQDIFTAGGVLFSIIVDTIFLPIQLLLALLA